jgi:transposase-like protein
MRPKRSWSEADDLRLVELSCEGKKIAEIAKETGRAEEGVRQRLLGIGLRSRVKLLQRKYLTPG